MIGHTQPRRIAARSIAARLGDEIQAAGNEPVIGFKIRFTDATAPTTMVKLMTDGYCWPSYREIGFLRPMRF